MKIFKRNGYVSAWGNLPFGEEIAEAEYNNLLSVIRNKPTAGSGYDYRLREDLEWELYELPVVEESEDENEDEEATAEDYEAALTEVGI